jgi:hypothetical protein
MRRTATTNCKQENPQHIPQHNAQYGTTHANATSIRSSTRATANTKHNIPQLITQTIMQKQPKATDHHQQQLKKTRKQPGWLPARLAGWLSDWLAGWQRANATYSTPCLLPTGNSLETVLHSTPYALETYEFRYISHNISHNISHSK